MKTKASFTIFFVLFLVIFSCKSNKQRYEDYVEEPFPYVKDIVESVSIDTIINYNMSLPIETAKIFKNAGGVYNPTILNPVTNITQYVTSSKIAMNLGLYGVDFSYIRLFNQNEKTYIYLYALHKLSNQLGIPNEFFSNAAERVEANMDNNDSINKLSKEIFFKTDKYFKEHEQGSAAAFMIMGGWIESMYISCKMYEDDTTNQEIINRLIKQKYTLNMLIAFLYNFQSDIVISKYIIMLKVLKKSYENISIYQKQGRVNIDTINKTIPTSSLGFIYNPETIDNIINLVFDLRKDVIN